MFTSCWRGGFMSLSALLQVKTKWWLLQLWLEATATSIMWDCPALYLKKLNFTQKKVPQTQSTPRNPKRERRMKKPIHTNQRAPNLSFISLSALKKKKNSWFCPLPPHSSQVRIVGLQNNNKRQQQVLPLSCKRNTIAFGGTWARDQTLFWKTRRKRNRMMRGVNSEKCWLRDTEMLFPGVIICLSECPETSHT